MTKPKTDYRGQTGNLVSVPARALVATPTDSSPGGMIAYAMQTGASIEHLRELYALKKEWEADEARKAFVVAMAEFKSEPMAIGKNKKVSFTTAKGKTEYMHAELADVTDVIVPNLSKHGLSHDWKITQDKAITVVCTITHVLGHSKSVEMTAPADDSGGKNSIQAIASTNTYLQRYTLLAACGLATGGADNDGRGEEPEFDPRVLYEATAEELEAVPDSKRKDAHDATYARLSESVLHIKDRIQADDLPAAIAEWNQFSQDEQRALWVAPSKGGCFTTNERALIRKALGANANTTGAGHD